MRSAYALALCAAGVCRFAARLLVCRVVQPEQQLCSKPGDFRPKFHPQHFLLRRYEARQRDLLLFRSIRTDRMEISNLVQNLNGRNKSSFRRMCKKRTLCTFSVILPVALALIIFYSSMNPLTLVCPLSENSLDPCRCPKNQHSVVGRRFIHPHRSGFVQGEMSSSPLRASISSTLSAIWRRASPPSTPLASSASSLSLRWLQIPHRRAVQLSKPEPYAFRTPDRAR